MNTHREYFLGHLGVGEQWVLRKSELPLQYVDLESSSAQDSCLSVAEGGDGIGGLREAISSCQQCPLCSSNGKLVLSNQVFNAEVLVIYDWSENENFELGIGINFKKLLVNILKSIAIEPGRIASISVLNASFPSANLVIPSVASAQFCGGFLRRSIALSKAKNLLVFGARAANVLLENNLDIEQLRASQMNYAGLPVFVTYSPYQLLTQPSLKREVWKDLCHFQVSITSE